MARRNCTATWVESANRWQVCVTNDEGFRKVFTCSTPGRAGQTECNRKADKWLLEGEQAHGRCGPMINAWLDHVKVTTGESNYRQRKSHMDVYVLPAVKNMKLEDIGRQQWQAIIDDAFKKGLSKKSLTNIRGTISAFLTYYDRSAKIVVPSSAASVQKHILQPDGLKTLLTDDTTMEKGSVKKEWFINYYRLCVVTGMRPGEALALQWKHITDNRILIRGAINALGESTNGKNKNAIRDEALTVIAKSILDDQKQMLMCAGIISPYVFPSPDGNIMTQCSILRRWQKYQKYHMIPVTTLYELRHTFTSVIAGRSNMTLQELRSVMGHSTNMDTLGVYSKDLDDSMARIRDKTDEVFKSLM